MWYNQQRMSESRRIGMISSRLKTIIGSVSIWTYISFASAIWGVHWFSIPFVQKVCARVAYSEEWMIFAVFMSLMAVFISLAEMRSTRRGGIWPLLLPLLILFWSTYWLLGFGAAPIKGVAVVFAAMALMYICYRRIPCPQGNTLPTDEELERKTLYTNTINLIRQMVWDCQQECCGRCLALFGRWGSGKSHFVSHLASGLRIQLHENEGDYPDSICRRAFRFTSVDVWHCNTGEEAWENIVNALYFAISGNYATPNGFCRHILHSTGNFFRIPMLPLLSTIMNFIFHDSNMIEDEVNVLNDRVGLDKGKLPIFLVLENLDRCPVNVVLALFPILEKLKRIKGLIVFCVIAKDDFAKAWPAEERDYRTIQGYFDKTFDYTIELPPPDRKIIQDFFLSRVKRQNGDSNRCPLLCQMAEKKIFDFDTPRQAIRVATLLSGMEYFYLLRYTAVNTSSLRESVCLCCELIDSFYGEVHNELIAMPDPDAFVLDLPDELFEDYATWERKGTFPDKKLKTYQLLEHERLLKSVVFYLRCNLVREKKMLSYALHKQYIVLDGITIHECRKIIDLKSKKESASCWASIDTYYKGRTLHSSILDYYKTVFEYALEHYTESLKNAQFVSTAIKEMNGDDDLEGIKGEYMRNADLLFRLLSIGVNLDEAQYNGDLFLYLKSSFLFILEQIELGSLTRVTESLIRVHHGEALENVSLSVYSKLEVLKGKGEIHYLEEMIFYRFGFLLCAYLRQNRQVNKEFLSPFYYDRNGIAYEKYIEGAENSYSKMNHSVISYSGVNILFCNIEQLIEDENLCLTGFASLWNTALHNPKKSGGFHFRLHNKTRAEKICRRLECLCQECNKRTNPEESDAEAARCFRLKGLEELQGILKALAK